MYALDMKYFSRIILFSSIMGCGKSTLDDTADTDATDTEDSSDTAGEDTSPSETGDSQTEPVDTDGDGVWDSLDPAPENPLSCGDSDNDGCDDCVIHGTVRPDDDGWDQDNDGLCEVQLDPACLHGEDASTDPDRRTSCLLWAFANLDRALFSDESDGAPAMIWNEDVWRVAYSHSKDMCTRNFYAHQNPEGERASDRAARMGFDFSLAENIHVFTDPVRGHYDFMNEPSCTAHRNNILQPRATTAAVALYKCDNQNARRPGWYYTTENFAWDWTIEPAFCEIEANVCNDPPEPVSVAKEYCSDSLCQPMSDATRDRYCE